MKRFIFEDLTKMNCALAAFRGGLPKSLTATETHNGKLLQWEVSVVDDSGKQVAFITAKNATSTLTIDAGSSSMKSMLETICARSCGDWAGREDRSLV